MKWRNASVGLLLAGVGCTTVEIEEREVFDVKKTVDPSRFEALGFRWRPLQVPTPDGETLSAWHLDRQDERGLVLVYGGNGFLMVTARALLDALTKLPVDVLMFDYRGYGSSSGTPSVAALRDDAELMLERAVNELGYTPDHILLHGHSLGAFVAMYVAERHGVAGVVLENPVSSAQDLVDGLVPWFLDPLITFELAPAIREDDNVKRAEKMKAPLLVFAGEEDPIAPARMARAIDEAAPRSTLVVLERGSHNDLPTYTEFVEAYAAFVAQHLATGM